MDETCAESPTILLSGMGRSGTTWLGEILNCRKNLRVLFEPFLPAKVPQAEPFDYLPYLRPREDRPELARAAAAILRGDVSGPWVNKYVSEGTQCGLLIKDIRTNLMLAWLRGIAPGLKIVLVIRHPLQVAHSWVRLGWKKEAFGTRSNYRVVVDQQNLLDDFPAIARLAEGIDPNDHFQDVVFQWCVYNAIPLRQLAQSQARVVFYEDMVIRPEPTLEALIREIGLPYDARALGAAWSKVSSTNYLKRDHARIDPGELVGSWQSFFTEEQVRWAGDVLHRLGLDRLYDDEGMPTGNLEPGPEQI